MAPLGIALGHHQSFGVDSNTYASENRWQFSCRLHPSPQRQKAVEFSGASALWNVYPLNMWVRATKVRIPGILRHHKRDGVSLGMKSQKDLPQRGDSVDQTLCHEDSYLSLHILARQLAISAQVVNPSDPFSQTPVPQCLQLVKPIPASPGPTKAALH